MSEKQKGRRNARNERGMGMLQGGMLSSLVKSDLLQAHMVTPLL
jgi:hypothetical protein